MRAVAAAAVAALVLAAPAQAVPLVGTAGLVPNARALLDYLVATYPAITSIGGVRADALPEHPSGRALDVMVPNTALGNTIAADVRSQAGRFGVVYVLWQVPAHYDHIHITVA